MGRARLAAARDSIRLRARPQARRATSYRYENTEKETSRGTWAQVDYPGHRGELARRAFHESRVSRTIRRLQSPSHKRQGWDAAASSMQDVKSSEFRMRGRRRRPHASRHTRHGTTRSRTGLPERARGVSPAAHRIALPGQAAHRTATPGRRSPHAAHRTAPHVAQCSRTPLL